MPCKSCNHEYPFVQTDRGRLCAVNVKSYIDPQSKPCGKKIKATTTQPLLLDFRALKEKFQTVNRSVISVFKLLRQTDEESQKLS